MINRSGWLNLTEEMIFQHILPKSSDLHKGSAGKLFIIAGSRAFRGAAVMATGGALRSGCGFVTLASTPEVCETVSHYWATPTYAVTNETQTGRIAADAAESILKQAEGYDAMVLGCGLGNDRQELVRALVRQWKKTLILDADGLNAISTCISMLKEAQGPLILTPHEGEMARLTGKSIGEIHEHRRETAKNFSNRYGICLVLKGPRTLVVSPAGEMAENHTGNSGLAKAGSGDILSGMIGSLAAQGLPPFWAASGGVYLHGAAADLTALRLSKYAMQPTDLLEDLPKVFLHGNR